jgi:glutaredoxin
MSSELNRLNVPFVKYIPKDQEEVCALKIRTNMITFPMLFINKKLIGGYDDLIHLVMTNQLATLLEVVGIKIIEDF